MAPRLKVRDAANAAGLNLSQLQDVVNRRLNRPNPVAIGTLRRYWYSTRDGSAAGKPIEQVDLVVLGTIAKALGVPIAELMNEDELGQVNQARQAA